MEEFDAIATNFPFIDSFGVLDVNRCEFVLPCNDQASLVSFDSLVVLDIKVGPFYLEKEAIVISSVICCKNDLISSKSPLSVCGFFWINVTLF